MDRRTFLALGGAAFAGAALGIRATPEPYFERYSLRGLYDVLEKTTSPDYQVLATHLLFDRMDGSLPGHDHLTREGKHLIKYGGKVTFDSVLHHRHPYAITRGSRPYSAIINTLPTGRERVWNSVERILVHPNVRSSFDSDTFSTGGVAVKNKTILVEYHSDPGVFLALTMHESVHQELFSTSEGKLLLTEREAMRAELGVLAALPSAASRVYAEGMRVRLDNADRLAALGQAFHNVYPRQRIVREMFSSIPDETLQEHVARLDASHADIRDAMENELWLREQWREAAVERERLAKEMVYVAPSAPAGPTEEIFPDPGSDSVIVIV